MEQTNYICVDSERNVYTCEECGHLVQFEADGPYENGWDVCPHCTRRIRTEG